MPSSFLITQALSSTASSSAMIMTGERNRRYREPATFSQTQLGICITAETVKDILRMQFVFCERGYRRSF